MPEVTSPAVATGSSVAEIRPDDLDEVVGFLVSELRPPVDAATWRSAVDPLWQKDAPNRGYLLRDGQGAVVGAYLAFYSSRTVGGRRVGVCNLGPWAVRPEHRAGGLRLLRALLKQPGLVFTDLSPSGAVVPLNERLGFRHLDTATSLMPNLPRPTIPGRVVVTESPARIRQALSGDELATYLEHEGLSAARHLLVAGYDSQCHVIWRRDRRKGLPLFASILHVSDADLFRRCAAEVGRHLLVRHGVPLTLAEHRVVGGPLHPARQLAAHRPKMVRGELADADVDYLFSELTCLPW